jgi:hypothetical protein
MIGFNLEEVATRILWLYKLHWIPEFVLLESERGGGKDI